MVCDMPLARRHSGQRARMLTRRRFLTVGTTLGGVALLPRRLLAQPPRLRFADMHSHHGMFVGKRSGQATRLSDDMRANGLAVVAMKVVADSPVLMVSPGRIYALPAESRGQFRAFYEKTVAAVMARAQAEGIELVTEPAHIDRALAGQKPSVVLASEGADFLEGDLGYLKTAYAGGLRHLQIMHFRPNEIGDTATEKPLHGGLTEFGREVIRECNRLGILVDVAHCNHRGIIQALETAKKPLIYSHGWVSSEEPSWDRRGSRAVHSPLARAIAKEGGVVGLFPIQPSLERYAAAMVQLADIVGNEHAGMGVDLDGLSRPAIATYHDLPALASELGRLGMKENTIDKVLGGNYLRVLKQVLAG